MSKHDLRVDWATHAAAKYACENWHYADSMPIGKIVKVGAWERGSFTGVVIFGRGANRNMLKPFGLMQEEGCELVRVALCNHQNPVSRIVALALRFLKRQSPGLRLVVSYADPEQGHHGGIYQAGNWLYLGASSPSKEWWHEGRWKHTREVSWGAFGGECNVRDHRKLPCRDRPGKHRYLMPLDPEMRERVLPLSKPYPKPEQASEGEESSRPATSGEEGGASPTPALQDGR